MALFQQQQQQSQHQPPHRSKARIMMTTRTKLVGKSSSSSSSSNSLSPAILLRSGSTTRKRLTIYNIGCGVLVILVSYVAIVVTVTLSHWPIAIGSSSSSSSTAQTAQERWNDIKAQRGLNNVILENNNAGGENAQNTQKKINPFHKHNLGSPLNHGVQPEVLLRSSKSNNNHVATAIKTDPDVRKHPTPDYVLTAYTEEVNYDDWAVVEPLPVRTKTTAVAEKLQAISYPRLNSCRKLPQQWPVDDAPVDRDSFLPWIHDVFPTADGRYIQFVAQNKRRCKSGRKEKHILHQMQPQAALFQHVSLKRVPSPDEEDNNNKDGEPRFRLATHDEADSDSMVTRFLCRFQPDGTVTTSEYNFDYDWTAYRKLYKASFVEDNAGIKAIHTSQLIFRCPVPEHLREIVRSGSSVKDDWATLFLDLIPVRTPPRFGVPNQYLAPQYQEFQNTDPDQLFDAAAAWGDSHILPKIQDSGRWANIPICQPSQMTYEGSSKTTTASEDVIPTVVAAAAAKNKSPPPPPPVQKKHRLVSCIWASAGYNTRGSRFAINDGQRRLLEWITYNSIIGFDHFYVYDNSGAYSDEISLKPVTDLFPDTLVTYIPWPSQVCNNNPNNVDSAGERSSQYAAESSCRLRFGPHVDWIGQFDIDEYLIPMGQYQTVTALLDQLDREDTKIISFASWRAWPRRAFIDEPVRIDDPDVCWSNEPCFDLKIPYQHTMLQAYNCDRQKPGQKQSSMPAEKQLYRADYVVQHFVHYSVATVLSEKNRTEYVRDGLSSLKQPFPWKGRAFPDPRQRFGDELTEGLMIHTKAVARQDTAGWERQCHINNTLKPIRQQGLCRLGVPFPDHWQPTASILDAATVEGYAYNCYVNPQVEDYLVPKLKKALERTANFFDTQ